ncbi:hypothetical protein QR680_017680 [Steinernema hermaphroditum]|uniref:Uncharacterized protein n=1 Tax=Steinernema hermaphroditum TaxID=289476 RepID=A0AA39LPG8_9BILA|nr:hypothetical protein QR680_017680 [Steinernema hermaphroditum]
MNGPEESPDGKLVREAKKTPGDAAVLRRRVMSAGEEDDSPPRSVFSADLSATLLLTQRLLVRGVVKRLLAAGTGSSWMDVA